jgi:Fe-Mn family superoxide dismutase
MPHQLPELPYDRKALEPHISAETIDFHYGKHHQAYVNNINNLVPATEYETMSLKEIILKAPAGGIFNNAAQIWNHTFYWNSLNPKGGDPPAGVLRKALDDAFGSFDEFKKKFIQSATTLFGSGWVWLVKKPDGSVAIENTKDAGNPMTSGLTPLLTCDVWEHAYYIDYRNARPSYLDHYWQIMNWEFAAKNLEN